MPSLAAENKRYFCVRSEINSNRDVKDVDVGGSNVLHRNSDSCRFGAAAEQMKKQMTWGGKTQALLEGGGTRVFKMQTGNWRSDMYHLKKAAYLDQRPQKREKKSPN